MKLHSRLLALAATALLTLPAAASDLTLVFKTVSDGKTGTSTEYMSSHALRMTDGATDSILDTAAGSITSIDHGKKQFSVMTLAELEASMQAANAQMRQMQETMKNLPPEARAQMQKMMGGAAGAGGAMGGISVTVGTGTRKIAGYDTRPYTLRMGDAVQTQMWTTTAITPPLQPGEMLRLQSMLNPMMQNMASTMSEFKKIQGLTLASQTRTSIMGRVSESSREVIEIKTTPIPAATFAVPAGYKKVDSPLKQMGR